MSLPSLHYAVCWLWSTPHSNCLNGAAVPASASGAMLTLDPKRAPRLGIGPEPVGRAHHVVAGESRGAATQCLPNARSATGGLGRPFRLWR
jgi:hypothetical protein